LPLKTVFLLAHLTAVLLAALALWSMRHELSERAATRLEWALPPALAITVAAILLIVSPGKRFELWTVGIVVGLAIGLVMGTTLTVIKDFARKLVRANRAWDGAAVAALLLLLTVARVITSDLMDRPSGKFGVLGAAAAFLAAYLAGRVITLQFYTAPKSIHLDMVRGERRGTD
jgi:hypothetical protein